MELIDYESGKSLAKVRVAHSLFQKVFGLTIGSPLGEGQCFLIKGCRGIHTIGMDYGIDAVFLDKAGRVLAVYENLRPYRVSSFIRGAENVVEFKAGFVSKNGIKAGDKLDFF